MYNRKVIFWAKVLAAVLLLILYKAWPFTFIVLSAYWISRMVRATYRFKEAYLLIAVMFICVSAAEIVFRIRGQDQCYTEQNENPLNHILLTDYQSVFSPPERGWLHVLSPDIDVDNVKSEFAYSFHTNSLGLPDREYVKGLHRHIYRIAALGDSFTEGVGAPADSSWPRLLQVRLRSLYSDSVEVMNCGVSGSDPVFEYMLIRQRLLAYHPDLIIVALNRSDISDCMTRGGLERFQSDGTVKYDQAPLWESIYANSFLVRRFINGALGYNYMLTPAKNEKKVYARAIDILKQTADSLAHISSQNHCELILAFHPIREEVKNNNFELQPVLEYAQHNGLKTINVFNFFKTNIPPNSIDRYYWKNDQHNNSLGYDLIARAIADRVKISGAQVDH